MAVVVNTVLGYPSLVGLGELVGIGMNVDGEIRNPDSQHFQTIETI